jgi:hypothetical protein
LSNHGEEEANEMLREITMQDFGSEIDFQAVLAVADQEVKATSSGRYWLIFLLFLIRI